MTIFVRRLLIAVAATGICATHAPAQTLATCADRTAVVEKLSAKYGETRQSVGLGANNSVVEIFASAKTGTWTIIVTLPTGQACLMASGEAFEALDENKLAIAGKGV